MDHPSIQLPYKKVEKKGIRNSKNVVSFVWETGALLFFSPFLRVAEAHPSRSFVLFSSDRAITLCAFPSLSLSAWKEQKKQRHKQRRKEEKNAPRKQTGENRSYVLQIKFELEFFYVAIVAVVFNVVIPLGRAFKSFFAALTTNSDSGTKKEKERERNEKWHFFRLSRTYVLYHGKLSSLPQNAGQKQQKRKKNSRGIAWHWTAKFCLVGREGENGRFPILYFGLKEETLLPR